MNYTNITSVSLSGLWKGIYSFMVGTLPMVRGWFGISANKVTEQGGKLLGRSIIAAIFVGFAKSIADLFHAVKESTDSRFLEAILPTSRWVEHVKNTYFDYFGSNSVQWSQGPTESSEAYINRLLDEKNKLIDVFKKQAITLDTLVESLKTIDPNVQVLEPYKLIKPWPGPEQYQPNQIASESPQDFSVRTEAYDRKYRQARVAVVTDRGSRPNTRYPVPVETEISVTDGTFTYTETSQTKTNRLNLLKLDLGSYNNLDGTSSRRFFSENNQGGRVEVVISESSFELVVERVKALKAAGIHVVVYAKNFLGKAIPSPGRDTLTVISLVDIGDSRLTVAAQAPSRTVTPWIRDQGQ